MTRPTDTDAGKRRKPPKPKHKRTCYKRRIRTKIAALRALNTCMESDDEARRVRFEVNRAAVDSAFNMDSMDGE